MEGLIRWKARKGQAMYTRHPSAMSRNRQLLILCLVGTAALVLPLSVTLTRHPKPEPALSKLAQPPPDATPVATQATPQPAFPVAADNQPMYQKAPTGGAVKDPEKVRNAAQAFNVPITFWGKVVDQDSRPLAGVQVRYSVRQMAIPAAGWPDYRSDFYELTTGGDGGFTITGKKGDSLSVEGLTKEGYQLGSREQRSFAYAQSPAIFTPDKQSPVVFTLVKATDPAQIRRLTARLGVPYNGAPVAVDPVTGRRGGGGRLKISCLREPASGPAPVRDYPWSITVALEGGGLVAVEPGAIYEAPTEGYQPQLAYEMRDAGADWKSGVRQEYYFKTAENLYGRLSIEIALRSDEPDAFVTLSGAVNMSGSRSLEP